MTDTRLREAPPVPAGAVLRPLSCQGPGRHDKLGYRCANYPLEGCLGFVCKTCAQKNGPYKPYCETCNVCALAEKHGSSMSKALEVIGELNPQAVKKGTSECASTKPGAPPCKRCIRHTCLREDCLTPDGKRTTFRSHSNRSSYHSDLCRAAARKDTQRRADDKRREQRLSVAA